MSSVAFCFSAWRRDLSLNEVLSVFGEAGG